MHHSPRALEDRSATARHSPGWLVPLPAFAAFLLLTVADGARAGPVVISGAGADRAAVQNEVDAYRAALGANNGVAPTPFPAGRRELNWDGVPDQFAAPNDLPGDLFAGRGALFSTPGSAVRVSADADNPTGTPVRFGDVNPTYGAVFQTFSDQRLFSPIGSNVVDLTFVVPGSAAPGLVSGFGAVYADADSAETSFEYFDAAGNSLGVFQVPPADNGLSFLGVVFDSPSVRRVRISYGSDALGPDEGPSVDVAVMDDFIYGEPQPVPLPPAAAMGLCALAPVLWAGVRRLTLR